MPVSSNLLASIFLHVSLALLVGLWSPMLNDARLNDQSLPIEIITIDQFTKLVEEATMPDEAEARQEAPAFERTNAPSAVQPDTMPLPDAAPPPDKAPTPELTQEAVPEEPRFRVASPVPLARPQVKPKPLLDIGRVQALLNKTPDQEVSDSGVSKSEAGPSAAERLTLSEVDAFRVQMRRCWSPPAGAKQAENLIVQVRLSLTPGGAISAGPVVVNRALLGDPFFRAAAESVLRAIRRCQPFTMPTEKYASWRNIELTFDPRKMLGG